MNKIYDLMLKQTKPLDVDNRKILYENLDELYMYSGSGEEIPTTVDVDVQVLTRAMTLDGFHPFWIDLVVGGIQHKPGPRGLELRNKLWRTMPNKYKNPGKQK